MRGPKQTAAAIVANPVLVGAVTLLVTVIGVFLAYTANSGLPFIPTFQLNVETPNAARLVPSNEIREGGFRIGQVKQMKTIRHADGTVLAQLELALDRTATPIPADTQLFIRPRSTLGLKYIDLVRGNSKKMLPEGATITTRDGAVPPEIDDVFESFTTKTRLDIQANLGTFGAGLAGRGKDLNQAILDLAPFLRDLVPVMRTLSDPDTQLVRFFRELQETATATVPVARELSHSFTAGADVFEAFSSDPEALRRTIEESPEFLRETTPALIGQRPFLRDLANISDEVQSSARAVRQSARPISTALAAGTRTLPQTPPFARRLASAFDALRDLSTSPTTNLVLNGLTTTVTSLNHTLRFVGPHVTVCNSWNYWWTFLADHIAEENDTGTLQRIQVKNTDPFQPNTPSSFGASEPANGNPNASGTPIFGDPVNLHAQPYPAAVNEDGSADCENGQRGYPERLAKHLPERFKIAVDPRTPGSQGPTYTGRARVPDGQTWSREPTGLAPPVVK